MHTPKCDPIQTLSVFLIGEKNYQKIISPVKMVRMVSNTIVIHVHQVTLHDKKGPGENMLRIVQGVHNISHLTVDG